MECAGLPELGYGEFSLRLHKKVAGQRIPITASMELTFRCNLRCVHCYIGSYRACGVPGGEELSLDEIKGILDQLADAGCLWLLLTGGEPLVRSDFREIYTYAKRKGFLVTLFTNGTLITPEIADHLAVWRPFATEITLYGATEATYERVTGIPGSYANCMQGIEHLLERGIRLKLKTMAMTLNHHELSAMQELAEGLGVEFRFDPLLNAGLDGSLGPTKLRLPPGEAVELDISSPKRMESWRTFCDQFIRPPSDPEKLYHCGAGLQTCHIDPYGQMSVCMMSRRHPYDLREGTFKAGWAFLGEVREQPRTRMTACAHCDLISLCGQCPGWAEMEHGDQETPITYLCEVAHLRAEALGVRREFGHQRTEEVIV